MNNNQFKDYPVAIFLLSILLLLPIHQLISDQIPDRNESPRVVFIKAQEYENIESIRINDNSELISQGWPGSGGIEDPFILDGKNVTSIEILNTNLYVIIRNCWINSAYSRRSNNTVFQSCFIKSFIRFMDCKDNKILSNNVSMGYMHVIRCYNFSIGDNEIGEGLSFLGEDISNWKHNLTENTVHGKPLGYFFDTTGLNFDPDDYGELHLVNCSHSIISNGTPEIAIYTKLGHCTNCTFTKNINCFIQADYSSDLQINENSGCTTSNRGVYLGNCVDSIVENNSYSNNEVDGVGIYGCVNCTIKNNTVLGNNGLALYSQTVYFGAPQQSGISVFDSWSCKIEQNILLGNPRCGIWIEHCFDSLFLNNVVCENKQSGIEGWPHNSSFIANIVNHNGGFGMDFNRARNGTIEGNYISNNTRGGISLGYEGSNMTLRDNHVFDSSVSIRITECQNIIIEENTLEGMGLDIDDDAHFLSPGKMNYWKHTISNNTINGYPIGYLWGNASIDLNVTGYGQVFLCNTSYITIDKGSLIGPHSCIILAFSNHTNIQNLSIRNSNTNALRLVSSFFCSIENSIFENISFSGIALSPCENVRIEQCTFKNNGRGISLSLCRKVSILNCTFLGKNRGISLWSSSHSVIEDNSFLHGSLFVYGTGYSSHNDISNNVVNGRPLGYFSNLVGGVLDIEEYGEVILVGCQNVEAVGGTFTNITTGLILNDCINTTIRGTNSSDNVESGIFVEHTYNSTFHGTYTCDNGDDGFLFGNTMSTNRGSKIVECISMRNANGIDLVYDYNTTILDSIISDNRMDGVYGYYASGCRIENCIITGNERNGVNGVFSFTGIVQNSTICYNKGVGLQYIFGDVTSNNISHNGNHGLIVESAPTITDNIIQMNNGSGLILNYCRHSNIAWNLISNNTQYGIQIKLTYSRENQSNNTIFCNMILFNKLGNAIDDGLDNHWDNGLLGNAWGDWTGEGQYQIPGLAESIDRYPWDYRDGFPPRNSGNNTSASNTTNDHEFDFLLQISLVAALITIFSVIALVILRRSKTSSIA